jgi:hypothetical protein
MGTMKLSKYWVAKLVVNAMIITFLLWAIFTVGPQTNVEGFRGVMYFLYITCAGLVVLFGVFSVIIYNNEGKYYSIESLPVEVFKVNKYKNVIVFSYNGYAWVVNAQYKHTLSQKYIDVVYRYNRKKKQINFDPKLPYMMGV